MLFRFFLDLALVAALAVDPNSSTTRTAPSMTTVGPLPPIPPPVEAGPRPPKKPPEKRPHDSSWSEIKSIFGRRP